MDSKVFFILLLVIAGVAVFGLTTKPKAKIPLAASANSQIDVSKNALYTQSKTMGVVSVEVTPSSVDIGEKPIFDIVMNNHSVDLGYDYVQIAALTDDQGYTHKPTEWTGNSGGHHVKGQLIFPTLLTEPKQLTLTLKGVNNVTEDFIWDL